MKDDYFVIIKPLTKKLLLLVNMNDPRINYVVDIDDEKKIIISRISGEVFKDETALMGLKLRTKAKELGYKLILDFRDSIIYVSIIEAHNWFKDYYNKLDENLKHIPTVLLFNDRDKELFDFVDDSWFNQGIYTKTMQDETKALNWLESFE